MQTPVDTDIEIELMSCAMFSVTLHIIIHALVHARTYANVFSQIIFVTFLAVITG